MGEGLRSWLLIGLCSGLVPAYLLRQSSFLQLYCPSPPSDRDGIVIVQESHGQLFNSHNRCQQISSDKLIFINIFPIAKVMYVENLETAVSVICPYSSIRPGGPLQLMHSSLICQWLPFFSISVTFGRTLSSWGHRVLFGLHTGQVESTGALTPQEQSSTMGMRAGG